MTDLERNNAIRDAFAATAERVIHSLLEPRPPYTTEELIQSIAEGEPFVAIAPDPTAIDGTVTLCMLCGWDIHDHEQTCPWGYLEALGLAEGVGQRTPGRV